MSAVARRYAKAVVEAAADKGGAAAVEKLAADLKSFSHLYDQSSELRELLENPALKNEREKVLGAVLGKLALSAEAAQLVRLLAERDRVGVLAEVAREVEAEADERGGRVRAYVASAMALGDAHVQRLNKALEKRFRRPVAVSITVEPELLGGLVVRVGDVTLDTSLKRQLERLRERVAAEA